MNELVCLEHESKDGLLASVNGVRHGILVPVSVNLMEKAGTYHFVLHFKDNHADKYKDHKVKPALEMNATGCMPEAHNYDGTDFWDVAELASERQRKVGYVARDWTDEDPEIAMRRIKRTEEPEIKKPTIVSITNHGIPGGIYFRMRGQICDGWTANAYLGPENPFYVSGGKSMSIMLHGDFSSLKFIAFVGCNTGATHYLLGNLLEASVKKGTTCALGFGAVIMMGTKLEDDPKTPNWNEKSDIVREWTKAFWNAALNLPREQYPEDDPHYPGKKHPEKEDRPYGIMDAAIYAAKAIKEIFGHYYNWNKFVIDADKEENKNLVLIPPKCKN